MATDSLIRKQDLLIISLLSLCLLGCLDMNEAEVNNESVTEQCIKDEGMLREYFEYNITPIYEKSLDNAVLAAKMFDGESINILKNYSTIFRKCSIHHGVDGQHYSLLDANLFLLASLMEDVRYFYVDMERPDAVGAPFILMRKKYKIIFWELQKNN